MEKKSATKIIMTLTAVYTASYLCRYSYTVVLPEMVKTTGKSKAELSLAVTLLFVSYGIGQLVSGILGDRVSPKKLIIAGILSSALLNFTVPFVKETWLINIIWSVNGFAQAFVWPPTLGLLSALLTDDEYARGTVWVSYGGYIGTIMLYLIAPLFIRLWSWRGTFIFSSCCAIIIICIFAFGFPDVDPVRHEPKPQEKADCPPKPKKKKSVIAILSPTLLVIMLCIIAQGFIKDGITTWMPTYVSELFNIDSAASILTGILLPIFAMICLKLTSVLNRRAIPNTLVCTALLFGFGAISALMLFIIRSNAAVLTILFSVSLTGAMHGVNLMLIGMLPLSFKATGNVSTASGLLNFTTYVGSSASAYLLAAMSDVFSWSSIFLILSGISAFAAVLCFLSRKFEPN